MRPHLHKAILALALSLSAGIALADHPTTAHATAASKTDKPEVLMYVLPDCGYCAKARAHLGEIGVQWRELDIAASATAKAEFSKHGGQGTPLILVGEDRIAGYDVASLDAALVKHGLLVK